MTRRLKRFKYYAPSTIEEAAEVVAEQGKGAKVLAGGTDLISMMKLRLVMPESIVSLNRIEGLDYIRKADGALRIGALTTIGQILTSDLIRKKFASIYETSLGFATPQVRNMATIGGNICRSSPCANTPPPLMTLGAKVVLVGTKGKRVISLEDFITGPGENVLDGEILTETIVPIPNKKSGAAFMQLTRNTADLSKINCAANITISNGACEDIRIVLGSVSDKPVRARATEQLIMGERITDEILATAARKAVEDISPISDARSSAEYRRQVSRVLVARTIRQAIERAAG
jgi:carbon-monoxide dehydrogenase medium subunit